MGCYDSVFVKCPECGKLLEFQSKAGKCRMDKYKHTNVPAVVAIDLIGKDEEGFPYDLEHCCNKTWYLEAEIPRVSMRLKKWSKDEEEWD
jgi:hypothetical protein